MSKRFLFLLNVTMLAVPVSIVGYSNGARAITTTAVCTTLATCTTAGLNLNAATLRRPDNNALGRAHVGIFIMHPYSSYANFQGCTELASRGYTTLCANSIFNGSQYGYYGYEQHAPGIKSGLEYLKKLQATATLPAITKLIIFAHSAGAPLITFIRISPRTAPRRARARKRSFLVSAPTSITCPRRTA